MAVALEKLIDLNLLTHYDGKIKDWVVEQIKQDEKIAVTTREELPTKGEEGKIYFVEDGILQYTEEEGYKEIGSSTKPQWKDF